MTARKSLLGGTGAMQAAMTANKQAVSQSSRFRRSSPKGLSKSTTKSVKQHTCAWNLIKNETERAENPYPGSHEEVIESTMYRKRDHNRERSISPKPFSTATRHSRMSDVKVKVDSLNQYNAT